MLAGRFNQTHSNEIKQTDRNLGNSCNTEENAKATRNLCLKQIQGNNLRRQNEFQSRLLASEIYPWREFCTSGNRVLVALATVIGTQIKSLARVFAALANSLFKLGKWSLWSLGNGDSLLAQGNSIRQSDNYRRRGLSLDKKNPLFFLFHYKNSGSKVHTMSYSFLSLLVMRCLTNRSQ